MSKGNQKYEELLQRISELEESEQRFKLATVSGKLGIWDWDISENKMVWDGKMLELYGLTRDTFSDNIEAWEKGIHPEDRDSVIAECDAALKGEKEFNTIFRVLHPNGKVLYVKADGMVIRNSSNEPIRMIGTNRDVTESKLAELELSLRESYLKAIIENQPGLVWLKDIESRFLTVNNAFLQACGQSDIINKNDLDIWPEKLALSYRNDDKRVIADKKPRIIEEPISEKNEIKWFETFKAPVFDNNGEIIGTTGYSRDITEKKKEQLELLKAKEKAEESDRLKTAFLQNMSHEIRTPMNAIMGFADLIKENLNNKEKLIKFSNIISSRCDDLLDIINDILDIAKIESGLLTVNYEEYSINNLFEEISTFFKEYQKRLGKEHIKFNLSIPQETVLIKTDKVKLKQIFINLFTNALKFTEEGYIQGGYKIIDDKFIQFYVTDTGIGIAAEKQKLIFERFTQLNEFSKSNIGGTGLGLSIVKGLVKLFGGEIGLVSEPNKGSTFSFTIPKVSVNLPVNKPDIEKNTDSNLLGKTVLIVEDDAYNAEYINEILSGTGLKILIAENGRKALDIASSYFIDIILMDIRLPDMSGYEITEHILDKNPGTKIIAQTAYASIEEKEKAFNAGCLDYISKPIKRNLLLSKMNNLLFA